MADLGTLYTAFGADLGPLNAAVQQAEAKFKQYENMGTGAFDKIKDAVGAAKVAVAGFMAAIGYQKIKGWITEVNAVAARYDTLGIAMNTVGKNAGYSAQQMAAYEEQLKKTGISALEARNVLTQLTTANVDLAYANKLAEGAQNLAAAQGRNSSEVLVTLTRAIATGNTEVLRTIGLQTQFGQSQVKLAKDADGTTVAIFNQQKVMDRTKKILEDLGPYMGTYSGAMESAGKQAGSLARHIQDYQVAAGKAFQPAYLTIIGAQTDKYKKLTEVFSDPSVQQGIRGLADIVADLIRVFTELSSGVIKTCSEHTDLVASAVMALALWSGKLIAIKLYAWFVTAAGGVTTLEAAFVSLNAVVWELAVLTAIAYIVKEMIRMLNEASEFIEKTGTTWGDVFNLVAENMLNSFLNSIEAVLYAMNNILVTGIKTVYAAIMKVIDNVWKNLTTPPWAREGLDLNPFAGVGEEIGKAWSDGIKKGMGHVDDVILSQQRFTFAAGARGMLMAQEELENPSSYLELDPAHRTPRKPKTDDKNNKEVPSPGGLEDKGPNWADKYSGLLESLDKQLRVTKGISKEQEALNLLMDLGSRKEPFPYDEKKVAEVAHLLNQIADREKAEAIETYNEDIEWQNRLLGKTEDEISALNFCRQHSIDLEDEECAAIKATTKAAADKAKAYAQAEAVKKYQEDMVHQMSLIGKKPEEVAALNFAQQQGLDKDDPGVKAVQESTQALQDKQRLHEFFQPGGEAATSGMGEFDIKREQYAKEEEELINSLDRQNIAIGEYLEKRYQIEEVYSQKAKDLALAEQEYKLSVYSNAAGMIADTFQQIAQAGGKQSLIAFRMYQAFAIAEAVISGLVAYNKTLADPTLQSMGVAVAMANIVAAQAAVRVAMIASTQPPSYDSGGISHAKGIYQTGNIDEAHIPLKGGKVPVALSGQQGRETVIQLDIANIVSQDMLDTYVASPRGKSALLNFISSNSRSVSMRLRRST